jgi:hypothetical protein
MPVFATEWRQRRESRMKLTLSLRVTIRVRPEVRDGSRCRHDIVNGFGAGGDAELA